MSEQDHIVHEFLLETYENLDELDSDLVALEERPGDREILAKIFRTIHTIKGTCGFLGFSELEEVTHVGENLLSLLREGAASVDAETTTVLLQLLDAVREMLAQIEQTGDEGEGDYTALVEGLTRLVERADEAGDSTSTQISETDASATASLDSAAESKEASASDPLDRPSQATPIETGDARVADSESSVRGESGEQTRENGEGWGREASRLVAPAEQREAIRSGTLAESAIRVGVDLLDQLMNLVGELVLTRNQIVQFYAAEQDANIQATTQRLNLITTELQEGVMQTRMQPIGTIWDKFPRVVRDIAQSCRKKVSIEMDGRETELDKTIIEAIKDPLTHLVRNAVDHGIEPPEARAAAGKPPEGRLLLRAFHEGGQVNIEISDDGGGIDIERVRSKALERGVITQEQSECMSARELTNLIFSPGFSTAEKVTNVSGRGVGLDVVRTNIEKISGTIDLQAQAGQGTTVRIKIPLTLAIIPGLIVTCREQRYAIPQVSLVELVRFNRDQEVSGIEFVHGAPVHRLRGNLLPLVFLDQALGLGDHTVPRPSGSAPTRYPTTLPEARKAGRWVSAEPAPHDAEAVNIVVLQADECQFGLVVDHVNDTQEIVVKPLGKQLKGISCFAGAAILGDGRVALILDVLGLAQEATVLGKERGQIAPDAAVGVDGNEAEAQTLLLFSVGDDSRMAIPLSMVTRLEEFERSGFEQAGDQTVVQYRGGILPLIDLSSVFEREKLEQDDVVQVVVYSDNGRQVGFLVDEILDILETSLAVERCTDRKGILGSAIIQEKVTDLIDPQSVIRTHYPGVSDDHAGIPAEA